jgi:hypothetical protein
MDAEKLRKIENRYLAVAALVQDADDGERIECISCKDNYPVSLGYYLTGEHCVDCFAELEFGYFGIPVTEVLSLEPYELNSMNTPLKLNEDLEAEMKEISDEMNPRSHLEQEVYMISEDDDVPFCEDNLVIHYVGVQDGYNNKLLGIVEYEPHEVDIDSVFKILEGGN